MRLIVQKFGGTSVADATTRSQAAGHVARAVQAGWSPVVVVSAIGRRGAPYATDTLAGLLAANQGQPDRRELDLIMSCGEIVAATIFAADLRAAGLNAIALTGAQAGIRTDEMHGAATIQDIQPERIMRLVGQGKIPVVAGFQGVTASGEITTLGRGGSDITAVALGGALHAELTEIYTDVDGVMTADPRMVPDAKTIPQMTYDETSYLAYEGAKVLHPRAVELAGRFGQPVRIRSTFTEAGGTLVTAESAGGAWGQRSGHRPVTGITHTTDLALLTVTPQGGDEAPYTRTFRTLADVGINVDMIAVTPAMCSFVVDAQHTAAAVAALSRAGVTPTVREECAKVVVVGRLMRYTPGVMAQVSEALVGAGVGMLQTSDSLNTISCLIDATQLQAAIRALHHRFRLEHPEQDQGGITT
jgi:aspartate kinase